VVVFLIVSSWKLYTATEVNKITVCLGSVTPQEPLAVTYRQLKKMLTIVITEKF
jgi:hypothetical protein